MKLVIGIVRHESFEPIRTELLTLGFPSLTISEVKGSGRQKGITEKYRGSEVTNYLRPKIKIECIVASSDVQTIVDTILKHGRTGAIGDGKVFVVPVEEAYRVRTGESGEEVLQAHPDAAAAAAPRPVVRGAPAPGDDGAPAGPESDAGAGGSLVERLRAVHLSMVEAVLGGEGLGRVAELASEAAGGPVAIVVPRLGVAVAAPAASPAAAALPALRRYAADRVKDRPVEVPGALVAEAPIATGDDVVGIVALVAGSAPAGAGGRGVPAPRGGRVAHRGRRRGGQGRGRAEPARLVPGGPPVAARSGPARGRPPRRTARVRPVAGRRRAVRRAAHGPPAPRRGDDRRGVPGRAGPAPGRPGVRPAAGGGGRRRARDDADDGAAPRDAAAAPRHRRAVVLLRRPGRLPARDPGGRARARRPAPVGRADRRGHRDRHLPAAVPRPGLAPRGGPLLLRGHGRADRQVRRPVPDRSRRARSSPTSSRTAT